MIQNFDVIYTLNNLKFLSLDRMNSIPNINFINSLINLNTFISANSKIIDGNITPLLDIEESVLMPIRKNYYTIKQGEEVKLKDGELPYGNRDLGDNDIELWRRISY